jgi:formylglycine-generating enzyme required for sulfatase activity
MARRKTARHDFTIKTAQVLAERVAFHCSNPDCRVHTVGPHSASDKSVKIGEAAHITAAAEDGPRYDGALTPEQRRSPDNGIWLCCDCHTLIDRDPGRFPTEELHRWKQQAEQLAFADLTGATGAAPTRAKQGPCLEVIERVLRRYCDDRVLEWEEARADPEDPDKLKHYVEPHYSLLKKGLRPVDTSSTAGRTSEAEKRNDPYEAVAEEGDDAIAELVRLLSASKRLCITEDAGAGKSIFTRRLLAFLCGDDGQKALFAGQPCLVVRWEPRVRSWPESFTRQGLIAAIAEAVTSTIEAAGASVSPTEVAEWAIREGRVFLILDALDQVTHKQSVTSLEELLHSSAGQKFRIVLTSRAYAVADHATLFHDTRGWRFGRIDAFDQQQQEEYLAGLDGGGLRALFPNYDEVEQLLRIPVVLAMVRELAEAGSVRAFRTRGDLYLQVHEHLTLRAARKLGHQPDSDQQVRWSEILAATACEMMVRGFYNYAVQGCFVVRDVHQGASRRCQVPITSEEWHVIESVSGLTDRCILEGATSENLCWKHRGMMEFYCGLHLARNSQPGWVVQETEPRGQKPVRCGDVDVRRLAADQEWYWAWRFAIEMSPVVWRSQSGTLLASLAELFERPDSGARPNELIYRAWSLLDGSREDGIAGGNRVLERFESGFRDLLDAKNPVATALHGSFVRCPPEALGIDGQPFWMGTSDNDIAALKRKYPDYAMFYDAERPQHQVAVSPFSLQATSVTREQYRLFDPEHESVHSTTWWGESDVFPKRAPADDCPMINVTWYDACVFARWIGVRLPTEGEWEYACRAGTQTQFGFGDNDKNLGQYAWFSSNSGDTTRPVGQKKPNAWGLYDMHGNVWEWCQDWYGDRYYATSPLDDPTGALAGSHRVIRGGGWGYNAWYCRAAYRVRCVPSDRYNNLGFRLARTVSSLPR